MKLRDLFEAPISDISHVGNWEKNSSFRDPNDRKLLTNPKALQKIKMQWKHPAETNVNIILVNSPDANKHTEVGLVDIDWLERMMPRDFDAIDSLLKDDEVNIIYTNNKGSQRVPLTGWVMAHRFAHALEAAARRGHRAGSVYYFKEACDLFNSTMRDVMEAYHIRDVNYSWGYRGKTHFDLMNVMPLRGFCQAVGTFRSAREKKVRNPMEFLLELFAQYVFTGQMKLNPPPRSFKFGHNHYGVWDDEDYELVERKMDAMVWQLKDLFEASVGYSDGLIFLM